MRACVRACARAARGLAWKKTGRDARDADDDGHASGGAREGDAKAGVARDGGVRDRGDARARGGLGFEAPREEI